MYVPKRPALLHAGLTLTGAAAFCVFSRSWIDIPHLLYDIPAAIATFAFIAQFVIETARGRFTMFWWHRLAMIVAMTAATVGRQYWAWPISGHLSCTLAIALVQSGDARRAAAERIAYWIPVAIVVYLRLALLEQGSHEATCAALFFALAWGLPGLWLAVHARCAEQARP